MVEAMLALLLAYLIPPVNETSIYETLIIDGEK